jgi:hypothetical protein
MVSFGSCNLIIMLEPSGKSENEENLRIKLVEAADGKDE